MCSEKTIQQGRWITETMVSSRISPQYQQVLYSCQQRSALMGFARAVPAIIGGCHCCLRREK